MNGAEAQKYTGSCERELMLLSCIRRVFQLNNTLS